MTVKELIEKLQKLHPDLEVIVDGDVDYLKKVELRGKLVLLTWSDR